MVSSGFHLLCHRQGLFFFLLVPIAASTQTRVIRNDPVGRQKRRDRSRSRSYSPDDRGRGRGGDRSRDRDRRAPSPDRKRG
jgi:hypothetical protein